jgi:hypothetical protein
MKEWREEGMNERMNALVHERMHEWMKWNEMKWNDMKWNEMKWKNECMKWMNERTKEWINELINEWMNERISALTKERITKWKNSLSEGRSKQIMKRMNAWVHNSEAWLLHRWACMVTWEEFRNFFDANAACESRSGPRKVRAESLWTLRVGTMAQCFGSILGVRRRNIACIAVRYYESLLTDWSPVERVSTTFRDRAPHPRKQRPYFGDPRSHMTRKNMRFRARLRFHLWIITFPNAYSSLLLQHAGWWQHVLTWWWHD